MFGQSLTLLWVNGEQGGGADSQIHQKTLIQLPADVCY